MDDLKKYKIIKDGVLPTKALKIKLSAKLAEPYVKKGVLQPITRGKKPKTEQETEQ